MKLLSVVIPSFNEEGNIDNTAKILVSVLEEANINFELIFVSDGSRDATFDKIEVLASADARIKGIEFSRNFGKEAAIFAGLKQVEGDCCVLIDCDLQHPPENIPQMYKLWQEGYDVVEGIKSNRGKESKLHKWFANSFYAIMSKLMGIDMNATSDYKLIDRKVVDVLLELTERNTFFRALSFWVGFKTTSITYDVKEREFGESKWSFFSLLRYAVLNTTSFTTAPLQLITVVGIGSILTFIILVIQTMVKYLMGTSVEGFTTVILLILIIGGLLMVSLGIIGHYLARIYEEVKARPRYIIARDTKNYIKKEGKDSE